MARRDSPSLVVIAGPNGAGKSTLAPALLNDTLEVTEFVNADVIARGLSGFAPETMAMAAGRLMLARIRALAEQRASFAFETTLASRSFSPWIRRLIDRGHRFHLVFLSLPSTAVAVQRVANRVRMGGGTLSPPKSFGAATGRIKPRGNRLDVLAACMAREMNDRIARAFAKGRPIDRAVQRAARSAILQHRRAGVPVVIWRDGKVVQIAAEILLKESAAKKRTRSNRARQQ